jgi:hypothetical protein
MIRIPIKNSLNSTFAHHEHTEDAKERISEGTLEYHVQRLEDGVVKQTYHDMWDAVEWVKSHTKTKAKDESIYKRIQFAVYGCDDTKSAYGYRRKLNHIPGKDLKEEG